MKVRLLDGTEIQARGGSAGIIDVDDHQTPTWGLYLDKQWREKELKWPHEVIEWEDFDLPADEEALFRSIAKAWRLAKNGETVEIACDGGTGRTGTVVACLAMLSGVAVENVVAWTREHYHRWRRVCFKYDYQVVFGYGIPTIIHGGQYRLNIDPASITNGASFPQLQFFFWAKDAAGNATTSATQSVEISNCTPEP